MRKSLRRFNDRLDQAEERMSKSEHLFETIQSQEQQKQKDKQTPSPQKKKKEKE